MPSMLHHYNLDIIIKSIIVVLDVECNFVIIGVPVNRNSIKKINNLLITYTVIQMKLKHKVPKHCSNICTVDIGLTIG